MAEPSNPEPASAAPNVGGCPGGAEYGHGMSLTTVHAGGCCNAWAAAHPEAGTPAPEGEQ